MRICQDGLRTADHEFLLTISDDGSEFHLRQRGKGRGISNIKSRAALINADATWHSRNGHGTTFTLSKQLDQPA
jgi:signal transduction histidine kinase